MKFNVHTCRCHQKNLNGPPFPLQATRVSYQIQRLQRCTILFSKSVSLFSGAIEKEQEMRVSGFLLCPQTQAQLHTSFEMCLVSGNQIRAQGWIYSVDPERTVTYFRTGQKNFSPIHHHVFLAGYRKQIVGALSSMSFHQYTFSEPELSQGLYCPIDPCDCVIEFIL